MAPGFLQASTWTRTGPAAFAATIDPAWVQGKGAYGGLLGAAILRALTAELADARRIPRSLTVHFCAPAVPGPIALTTQLERQGATVSHFSARATQRGAAVCFATATFAAPRTTTIAYNDARAPAVQPPEAIAPLDPSRGLPTFSRFFEMRPAVGHLPFSGAPEALVGGYLRVPGAGVLDAPLAVGLLDAWAPAVITRLTVPSAAASVDFTVHFFEPLPLPDAAPDAHHLVVVRSRQAGAGYAEELCELFSPAGGLIAQARQLVALL